MEKIGSSLDYTAYILPGNSEWDGSTLSSDIGLFLFDKLAYN